ncbi:hypothetical protein K9N68_21070 [Kovacikia minuta CCNUW1]|uniref:hypothetical protein n=1 Tax=Kovacikia minuta TaxID=2931930 RepID=UPI001CCD0984|nr:hypothetical protein [Kovacikia minuta]UBF24198.1 hypothetical protein K9N68_21070 [Kovacikia minuta CCNUW1]
MSDLAREAGATVVSGSSLKAALDLNWEDPNECLSGLQVVLEALEGVTSWVETQPEKETATPALTVAEQVKAQDVTVNDDGTAQLKKGVARNRRISVEDPHRRHGRTSTIPDPAKKSF